MSNERKIYVGNLPPDTTSRDVEKLFSCFGKIIDIDIKNRNGPPFAFIQFDDRRDAEDAIRERDNYDLDGFSLRVEFPREIKQNKKDYKEYPRYDNPLYVPPFDPYDMYVPFNYGPFPRQDRFSYYGDYRRNNNNNNNNYPNYAYQNRRPRPPKSTDYRVLISNIPPYSNWQDVKDFMRRYGDVSYADVFGNGTGVCDFVSKEDFKYVLKHVNNVKFKTVSGQTSYIRVEEDRSRKRGYQRRSPRTYNKSRSRSRSRSKSKSRSTKSSHSTNRDKSSSSSERSDRKRVSKSKSKDKY